MVRCGSMWQGVVACGRGGGRVWGHVAGWGYVVGVRPWHRWGHVAGFGACGMVWGHVADVVAGCGGSHRGRDKWYGVRPMAWMETCSRGGACGRVWEHVTGCGLMWQGVEACHNRRAYGRGSGGDMWQALGTCGRV